MTFAIIKRSMLLGLSFLFFSNAVYANEGGKILGGVGLMFMLFIVLLLVFAIPVFIFRKKKAYLIFSMINIPLCVFTCYKFLDDISPEFFGFSALLLFIQWMATLAVIMIHIQKKRELKKEDAER